VGRPADAAHKQPGYAIVNISLKPTGGIPGDASSAQIDLMAELAETYSLRRAAHHPCPEHRPAACAEGRSLRDLAEARRGGPRHANLDLISDIIACPGLDYCSLANARSIPVAQKIAERFEQASIASATWAS
jgi:sulfite reductase (NADPH) hemoprotein beta-component